ncbi:MAG TPA: heme-binding protein [Paraburkholderia sp.]|jgi:glc operon protein GlcG|nr:heme-binding protein [Paraburkholderia sp.]
MAVADPLDLHHAQHLVDHLVADAKSRFGKPVCIAVCDTYGFLIAFGRADGAPVRSIAISQQKAYTCARIGTTTTAFHQRLQREDIPIGYFCDPLLTALPGGAPLHDADGNVIGAVGVSGLAPDQDQLLADSGSTVIHQ